MSCQLCRFRKWAGERFVSVTFIRRLRDSAIGVERRKAAKKVFEKLWVAGTLGSFFSSFYLGLPRDVNALMASRLLTTDNLERVVRYAFFFWLLVYFFTSNMRKESRQTENNAAPTVKDLVFDVLQTVVALTAAAFLGFLRLSDYSVSQDSYLTAFTAALGAVAVICLGSLTIFGCDVGESEYNTMRQNGLKVSLLGLFFLRLIPERAFVLVLMLEIQVGLWAVLVAFIRETLEGAT